MPNPCPKTDPALPGTICGGTNHGNSKIARARFVPILCPNPTGALSSF